MDSPFHEVRSVEALNGYSLLYRIETVHGVTEVLGTEQAKTRIREIKATETLRKRSTVGTMVSAAWDRTTNLVETPYRLGESLVRRARKVETAEDVVLYVPKIIIDVGSNLLNGLGEFVVTGLRITQSAAGTECDGAECLNKAGADIVSGANSLAGKHNVARTLHAEFGTDPETHNKRYRRQIDRVSYASAYTSTTIKLGAGQAGIQYVSPAFTNVGLYNNAEFVGQYEDAHRQRNREKADLLAWGASPDTIDNFYRNTAFTKAYRRRVLEALNAVPNKDIAVNLFEQASEINSRYIAESFLVTLEYIAHQTGNGSEIILLGTEKRPHLKTSDGMLVQPIYADYLYWTPSLETRLRDLAQQSDKTAIHVLGYMDRNVAEQAAKLRVAVLEHPDITL